MVRELESATQNKRFLVGKRQSGISFVSPFMLRRPQMQGTNLPNPESDAGTVCLLGFLFCLLIYFYFIYIGLLPACMSV